MEEYIGGLWDKLITRVALRGFPESRVELRQIEKIAPVYFRALGGDAGLHMQAGTASSHGARRRWLERIAGTGEKVELIWADEHTLYLPAAIDYFPTTELNREAYFWLLALAAHDVAPKAEWIVRNQAATQAVLNTLPGLTSSYQRLCHATLALRPDPDKLPPDEAQAERCLRQALQTPGSVSAFVAAKRPCAPLILWLHPDPPSANGASKPASQRQPQQPQQAEKQVNSKDKEARKRRAENVSLPQGKSPFMLLFRAESLFSWAEFVKLDRPLDDDANDEAQKVADDLDILSIANDGKPTASRIRFDLDLPAEAEDDLVLADGILYPEWHYRKQQMQAAHCRIQMMLAKAAPPCALPAELRPAARRLRRQFQSLTPQRTRLRGQVSGDDLDLDACVRFATERASGAALPVPALYSDMRQQWRDLSCLLLADLSLSTDAWLSNTARVIDVIRDSLYLFSEALDATGDRFSLYGFSSVRRHHVRCHLLKGFDERYDDAVRGRLSALKPGYYTRMGAAIRHTSAILVKQKTSRRLLLIVTDGKPNDLDQYEGRYGIEDTRLAVQEARQQGLTPFCVTIDESAGDYLPHLFGHQGFVVVSNAAELPRVLPRLYLQLTANA
ncbi:MAG: VWA domain-containing protein [Burkholderiales bacterium]|nr:VWA domain-containing protein [Burkholderiales bacterium]